MQVTTNKNAFLTPELTSGKKKRRLFSKIKSQMEFYFSDSNLVKDFFLKNLIEEDPQGYVNIEVFKTFNKLKDLTDDVNTICEAISRSEILKVNEEGTKVRRTTPIQHKDYDACTLYVEKIPPHADIKWVKDVFKHFGTVDFVNIPCFRSSNKIKGFAFVEFRTPEEVSKACEYYNAMKKSSDSDTTKAQYEFKIKHQNVKTDITLAQDQIKESPSEYERSCYIKNSISDSNQSDDQKTIKRKHESKDCQDNPKKLKLENEEINNSSKSADENPSVLCESGNDVEVSTNVKNKRKRRKQKKKLSERPMLRVMSKQEWKSYRNRYLTLQKSTMSLLKSQIMMQMHEWREDIKPVSESPQKGLSFQEGVILKITLQESIKEPAIMKDKIKAEVNAAFVEATLGCNEIFIRCFTATEAHSALQDGKLESLGQVQLLKGEEEEKYWNKIAEDRKARFNNAEPRNKRGRDKIIEKAAKLAEMKNKHIYFDEQ